MQTLYADTMKDETWSALSAPFPGMTTQKWTQEEIDQLEKGLAKIFKKEKSPLESRDYEL